jgi:hypothetical protein
VRKKKFVFVDVSSWTRRKPQEKLFRSRSEALSTGTR